MLSLEDEVAQTGFVGSVAGHWSMVGDSPQIIPQTTAHFLPSESCLWGTVSSIL